MLGMDARVPYHGGASATSSNGAWFTLNGVVIGRPEPRCTALASLEQAGEERTDGFSAIDVMFEAAV